MKKKKAHYGKAVPGDWERFKVRDCEDLFEELITGGPGERLDALAEDVCRSIFFQGRNAPKDLLADVGAVFVSIVSEAIEAMPGTSEEFVKWLKDREA